jgi:hypothetical protein
MNAIVAKALEMSRKLGYLVLQYSYVSLHWMLKVIKVQAQKWGRCGTRKELEKSYSGLGAEIYSLYKLGEEGEWQKLPVVQQQLQRVEEAEAKAFNVDAVIDQIQKDFLNKKSALQAEYSAKRASTASPPPDDASL